MANVQLVKHKIDFCDQIYQLSSDPYVKGVLGLPDGKEEDTKQFVEAIIQEEHEGKTVSRVILDENSNVIGITTLMFIDHDKKSCHIGSWLGHKYWGKGYNQASKVAILRIAFEELGLLHVLAGARKVNIRSQRAQEKLPFIRLHVEKEFPKEHTALETKEKQPCVLHAFYREDFIKYLHGDALD
ncbi:GNAT family N-acetyltransferase [Halalkalibacter okhensis]|uniref:GNAT family acetyltransferase n=1 Tax=Halalkalibacter okhensis TaxID=333138 RepID=A0A0B0IEB5_9BACI|nr:GNAT family N-acetyltransferase [Halalkalibacter okhensis]KHF39227.1 GNAT family acetyltransferase [Halalkalibacter okhensis]